MRGRICLMLGRKLGDTLTSDKYGEEEQSKGKFENELKVKCRAG